LVRQVLPRVASVLQRQLSREMSQLILKATTIDYSLACLGLSSTLRIISMWVRTETGARTRTKTHTRRHDPLLPPHEVEVAAAAVAVAVAVELDVEALIML
jgi:UDP-N-acetylmuramyl pentapeptide synthase